MKRGRVRVAVTFTSTGKVGDRALLKYAEKPKKFLKRCDKILRKALRKKWVTATVARLWTPERYHIDADADAIREQIARKTARDVERREQAAHKSATEEKEETRQKRRKVK